MIFFVEFQNHGRKAIYSFILEIAVIDNKFVWILNLRSFKPFLKHKKQQQISFKNIFNFLKITHFVEF